ncbi:helix-turn-helix domain-containing protein [Streptomyces sp. NPDC007983]|uniref:helix-turn-helix domain-containing protein n=1 Tax=Streptomyces sp. NPDC007983 TaxID=3364800 RepID=UPI0036E5A55D
MPTSNPPTARRQRLGAELRKLRERAGMSAATAAGRLGGNQTQISNIEAGRHGVSADRVRTLARLYSCGDQDYIDALAAMTGARTRGWWEEYREYLPVGLLDLAEVEHHATYVRVATMVHIPGLLQTTEHARVVFNAGIPQLAPYEVEHRVSHRIKRQAILHGDTPTPLTTIIHEAALRMGYGGSTVVRRQLQHLIDMGERDNITIVVIPFGAGPLPGSGQSVVYFGGPVPQLDTVELDTSHGIELVDAEAQLINYRNVLDRMQGYAHKPAASRDLIHRIAQSS